MRRPGPAPGSAGPGGVVTVRTNPSLALVKYWGKRPGRNNVPATTSIAVSLAGLETATSVRLRPGSAEPGSAGQGDLVRLAGIQQAEDRYASFFDEARRSFRTEARYQADSVNSFPGSAGLASSSSGFAALALGCALLSSGPRPLAPEPSAHDLSAGFLRRASALARVGSASAARAVYGGWTLLRAGARYAEALYPQDFWPEFRILVVVLSQRAKSDSSRSAMELTRLSSPYYPAWLRDSAKLARSCAAALAGRDLEQLGELARLSYSRMHASALAADPPVLYWLPDSVRTLQCCAELRKRGIGAWETMDAGPQVKILCVAADLPAIRSAVLQAVPGAELLEATVGSAPVWSYAENAEVGP